MPARVFGVYPIFSWRGRLSCSADTSVCLATFERCYEEKVVETRRLELLTLSLQRRCSAD